MEVNDLLLELRTEELPPKSLDQLITSLVANMRTELAKAQLQFSDIQGFATPRRLAIVVTALQERQADQRIEKRGPSLQAAYDEQGNASKALLGFARSCGVEDLSALVRTETAKGTWLIYHQDKLGERTEDMLKGIIDRSLSTLPMERKMRWGSSRIEFIRPVHSVVLLYGNEVVEAQFFNCEAGRVTLGHRFMSSQPVEIESPNQYVKALEEAFVMVDLQQRKAVIRQQLLDIGTGLGAEVVIDENLLNEVNALVEWPVALSGEFDPAFLSVPEEALISAMKSHQRYFHLIDTQGNLLPKFITVANIRSKDPLAVIRGNERVISPRLADSSFFYSRDKASSLEANLDKLGDVVFQVKLGSYEQKAKRISQLAGFIADQTGVDSTDARRAGLLCKADLVSMMVGEFPELQGLMGGYYARHDGETDAVAQAIAEHYLPTQSGGRLPVSLAGQAVAIADKLDTLTGLFGIGQPPSGSKDPFALRRQTLGIIRICIDAGFTLNIKAAIDRACALHDQDFDAKPVYQYLLDRLGGWYLDQAVPADTFNAVRFSNVVIENLSDCNSRVHTIEAFKHKPEAQQLIAANKRIANILKKAQRPSDSVSSSERLPIDVSLFDVKAESLLHDALIDTQIKMAVDSINYEARCLLLAGLQNKVDVYFEEVMVMSDNMSLQKNRLATLHNMRLLFLEVADFSVLQ